MVLPLDIALVRCRFARCSYDARALVWAGLVTVDERIAREPAAPVEGRQRIGVGVSAPIRASVTAHDWRSFR